MKGCDTPYAKAISTMGAVNPSARANPKQPMINTKTSHHQAAGMASRRRPHPVSFATATPSSTVIMTTQRKKNGPGPATPAMAIGNRARTG